MAIIFATDFRGEARLSQHREKSVGCRNQALALKFRLLSIGFTSARSDDECNGDIASTDLDVVFHNARHLSCPIWRTLALDAPADASTLRSVSSYPSSTSQRIEAAYG